MADQEVKNGGAEKKITSSVDLVVALGVEAAKAEDAVEFYRTALGAVEIERHTSPKRKADQESPILLSVLLQLGGAKVLVTRLEDEFKKNQNNSLLLVSDETVEAVIKKAVASGAAAEGGITGAVVYPGKSSGNFRDPFGILWTIVGKKTDETNGNGTAIAETVEPNGNGTAASVVTEA